MEIKYIRLPIMDSGDKGQLSVMESNKSIPFDIKRSYFIYNIKDLHEVRGHHAHKELRQVIFCINGSFVLELDDGYERVAVLLDQPNQGVLLEPRVWHNMGKFSPGAILMVVASDYYDADDYIRDYDEFLRYWNIPTTEKIGG